MTGSSTNAAILYHPDAYDAKRPQVKGRHTAGAGFLQGFIDHSGVDRFLCATNSEKHFYHFREIMRDLDPSGRPIDWLRPNRPRDMATAGCLWVPGPNFTEHAWYRRLGDERAYSLCGVTHTVASDQVLRTLGEYLTLPTQPWDALICTSTSVRSVVERVLEGHADFLARRFGGAPSSPVQLPVIPLGVDSKFYAPSPGAEADRADLRRRLGLKPNQVAGLFLGRLSFHAKAHPIPMFMAFERAQAVLKAEQPNGERLVLMITGQFPNEPIGQEFKRAASRHCPSVPVYFLDGADAEIARASWFASDFFVSLSDNIQESFGLTPVEAMAAGLPCIVSDWDGYKDTVEHGVSGFRIPTLAPPTGAGIDVAERYMAGVHNFDFHIGTASQATAVDVASCAEAIVELVRNDDLRRTMGQAAQARASSVYDWRHVVAAYLELWRELAARRASDAIVGARDATRDPPSPAFPDPFTVFAAHPTQTLDADHRIALTDGAAASKQLVSDLLATQSIKFAARMLLDQAVICDLIDRIRLGGDPGENQGAVVRDLVAETEVARHAALRRSLVWLHKFGLIELK